MTAVQTSQQMAHTAIAGPALGGLARTPTATVAPGSPDGEPGQTTSLDCRLCGTPKSHVTTRALSGDAWQCGRCGQRWDARRLATVRAYEARYGPISKGLGLRNHVSPQP